MKKLILIILIFNSLSLLAQEPSFCNKMLDSAKIAFSKNNYNAARAYCEAALMLCKPDSFSLMNRQIDEAIENQKKDLENTLQLVQAEQTKNKKIIDASYFYADRYGLAVKKEGGKANPSFFDNNTDSREALASIKARANYKDRYGFINKNGKVLIRYNYSYAQPFDARTGFAIVKKKEGEKENLYLIDTLQNEYRMEYAPTNDESVIALDLREKGLNTIPTEVFQMKQLKVLLLGRNLIKAIPPEINHLPNLVYLDFDENLILKLENLDSLTNLKRLNIAWNQITRLEGLINLNALLTLNLCGNTVVKLEGLNGLKELRNLNISYNYINKLENLEKLNDLEVFDISEDVYSNMNKIVEIEGLDSLINLKELYLRGNKIAKIERIENLTNLRKIDLSFNLIKYFENIENLSKLETLYIYGDSIYNLENLEKLESLQYLFINWKVLKMDTLPNLKALSNITTLNLSGLNLEKLPIGFEKLINLKELDLSYNEFTTIPPQIRQLSQLEQLNISNNQISKLEGLDNLMALRSFSISQNLIKEISPSFWGSQVFNTIYIDFVDWIKSCSEDRNYALALTIRKGIQNKNLDLEYEELLKPLVFCHDFEGTIWAGEKYIEKGGEEIYHLSNLAMGYLYNGDYDKAYTIYAKYKNRKDIFLQDLSEVATAKVPPKNPQDIEKIIKFLKE